MGEGIPPSDEETMTQSPQEEPNLTEIQRDNGRAPKKSSGLLIGGAVLFVILVLIGLFLPPISLGSRLSGNNDQTAATTEEVSGTPESAAAANPSIPGEITLTVTGDAVVNVAGMSLSDFVAANASAAMPAEAAVQGNVYVLNYEGDAPTGQVTLNVPAGVTAAETLDLLGWNGSAWQFIPNDLDAANQQIMSHADKLPQAYALVVLPAPAAPELSAEILPEQTLPVDLLPIVTQVVLGKLSLASGGTMEGSAATMPTGAYSQYLAASNTGAMINAADLAAILNDSAAQTNQINTLVTAVQSGGFAGLNLDYQEVAAADSAAFTQFVSALADALRQQGLKLALTLGTPQFSGSSWNTGGQDWAALGRLADEIYIQMPLDPSTYENGGLADQVLAWAVRQIDRQKLNMLVSANAINRVGESFVELPNDQALSNFGELAFVQGSEAVEPGTAVEVALSGTASPLEWDGASLTYKYSYENNGQTHNVWLANAASLAHRLNLAKKYNLGGVAVRGLGAVADGPGYAAALKNFASGSEAPTPASAAIVWTVKDENGSVIASGSGEDLTFAWEGAEAPGAYTIQAEFALGDNVASLDEVTVAVAAAEEEVVVEATPAAEETGDTTFTGDADALVKSPSNVRTGPGVQYGIIAGGLNTGAQVKLIGRNNDASWLNIIMPSGEEGWIFASLVTVNPRVNVNALEVVEVAAPAAGSGTGSTTTNPAPPVSAAPVTNAGFELGGQAFGAPYGVMNQAGMTWVKKQIKWGPGTGADAATGFIAEAHGAGFKILLSIPGQSYPSDLPDFGAYVEFLRAVASLPDPPDAIEVWNEQNINAEWPSGQIDPALYVNNMLAPAYNAIKSANSRIMVISGALAPTGGNGPSVMSDDRYIAGMIAAGAASYLDCVGAHHNAGATSPSAVTGHPADGGDGHYSWYFQPTLNLYSTLGKPVCFTELGYTTSEGLPVSLPSNFSWANNITVAQQAQWLAEAASLSASSGRVRLLIVFNIDKNGEPADQWGYAIIRPGGGCPACSTLGQVMGR